MIDVRGVSKTFASRRGDHHALADVTLHIQPGQFVCLVGPSGCGKSTLLNLIAGLEAPDEGEILVDGKRVDGPGPDRSMMFQDSALFPWLTVRKNVEFGLELARWPRAEWDARVELYLKKVHLWRFRDAYVHELSGGMRQRVALARALAPEPRVLLMDEPFAALDEQTRTRMGNELLQIWEKTGRTVVFVTHGLTEAIYLADRVFVMGAHPGRIIESFPIELPRPRTVEMIGNEAFGRLRNRIWHLIGEA